MDCQEAIMLFENNTKKSVIQIERCSVGIANYVFAVSTAAEKFIFRCSKEEDAYKATVYWLSKLSACEIPIPIVLAKGTYRGYSYLVLSHIPGDDLGNVYDVLNNSEKIHIVKKLQQEIKEYLDAVRPTPYLDDISTKNLLIYEGKVSGIIDIDWVGLGDMLTFAALTKVALLNMNLDTRYVDYLLDEIENC